MPSKWAHAEQNRKVKSVGLHSSLGWDELASRYPDPEMELEYIG